MAEDVRRRPTFHARPGNRPIGRCARMALLISVLAAAGGTPAATRAAETAASPWSRHCAREADGREQCFVEQYAVAMPANTVVLNIRFGFAGPDHRARMVATAPLGILLQPGLGIAIDAGKPILVPFESCNSGGCRATAEIDTAGLAHFRRGTTMTVRYAAADRRTVEIPVSLAGLDAAMNNLAR